MYRVGIITASDKGSKGERVDESGPKIKEIVSGFGYKVVYYKVLPDDFSKRDNTPEATLEIAEKLVPGISEAIRNYSMQFTKKAMLSRGVSAIRKETLIINMPGSPKAVKESMECIMPALNHGIDILKGSASECGRQ